MLNGLFALSELAVVSARIPRLKTLAAAGQRGAKMALALANDPGRFLSAVQIGITLIGIVNGAFSGEAFGGAAGQFLVGFGLPERFAAAAGYGLVLLVITYLSVIVGELVPKTLALRNPEGIACAVAPFMTAFSKAALPAVWLLDVSTQLVFRLFGQRSAPASAITDEEIRTIMAEAETAGVLVAGEREMIAGVMRFADRAVSGLMTPRTEVDFIDVAATESEIRRKLFESPHSRLPVCDGSPDNMLGVATTRDMLVALLEDKQASVLAHTRKAPVVPETVGALQALKILREADVPMALVHDEYGHFIGVVTPADVLEAIAGVFRSDRDEDDIFAIERADGSWLLPGSLPVDEMADLLGVAAPATRDFEIVAGFVLHYMRRFPKTGEMVEVSGWTFEVVDLDGRRIDKVLAQRVKVRRRQML